MWVRGTKWPSDVNGLCVNGLIGDVKIKGIVSGSFKNDVLGALAKRLKCRRQSNGNLGLIGAEENLDLERAVLEQANVFWLDVFKIDKDEVRACCHGRTLMPCSPEN